MPVIPVSLPAHYLRHECITYFRILSLELQSHSMTSPVRVGVSLNSPSQLMILTSAITSPCFPRRMPVSTERAFAPISADGLGTPSCSQVAGHAPFCI